MEQKNAAPGRAGSRAALVFVGLSGSRAHAGWALALSTPEKLSR